SLRLQNAFAICASRVPRSTPGESESMSSMVSRIKRVKILHLGTDCFLIAVSVYSSAFVVFGLDDFRVHHGMLARWFVFSCAVRIAIFILLGVYDMIWRYVSLADAMNLAKGVLLSSILITPLSMGFQNTGFPSAFYLVNTLLILLLTMGARVLHRLMHEAYS